MEEEGGGVGGGVQISRVAEKQAFFLSVAKLPFQLRL